MKKKRLKIFIIILLVCVLFLVVFIFTSTDVALIKKFDAEKKNIQTNKNYNNVKSKNNEYAFNLPILIIDTNGAKINGEEKIEATIKVYDNNGTSNYLSDEPLLEERIGIKIRGNTTRKLPKKQYSIEFLDNKNDDKKIAFLGMEKESDWTLNAPFEDKSFIRDVMAYHISNSVMEYSPDTRYCEVFLLQDNEDDLNSSNYKGIYIAIEKIKRSENRVSISKNTKAGDDTSFIISKNPDKPKDIVLENYGSSTYLYGNHMILEYPFKNVDDKQIEDINRYVSEFERILYSDKYDVDGEGYENYIDVDSFVDYYILNEFFRNTDSGIFSTYFYKDYGEKMKAGPIWDFNTSMGNSNIISDYNDYTGLYMAQRSWFDRLLKDRKFVDRVILRYEVLRKTYLSDEFLLSFIDEKVEFLGQAPYRNFERWPINISNQSELFKVAKNYFSDYGDDIKQISDFMKDNPNLLLSDEGMAQSYEEEIEMLKNFIVKRGEWLDINLKNLYKFTD